MSAISARGRVYGVGARTVRRDGCGHSRAKEARGSGCVVEQCAWQLLSFKTASGSATKTCHVQRHMAALRSAHMGSATQIHSIGTGRDHKLVGHMARYGKLVIENPTLTGCTCTRPLFASLETCVRESDICV